ncbi:MAG: hypothetical protein A2406_01975 [Candidatus Komeilibacteria bacterium RIFOXYC1_FULL_37_11]|uniref:Glycosyl transferase family 1 domain-containing protein n=1 Tax=Candidatus Komeilibacteria bacterium RIFOXYC1_FULL_37_11 TaxID=1798555 RepID=A0A1G2BYJ1_9BACT|nr:MAG: hypothetical protein A2406_01975 [Candidatus Komeilibacteria bacterium RIFOXYC1_FULL_37_11]OGY95549.1 MAG: hypothetical protein A2611_02525 [Candidatus Komeilibacteria bacterium RIFOXYD1_FULL_37_29]
MNIGIDIRALGNKNWTGIGKYVFHSILNILKTDNQNQYYLFSTGLNKDLYEAVDFNQRNVQRIHIPISNKLLNLKLITGFRSNIFDKFFEEIDLFWMPNINFFSPTKKCPTILTVHDLSFLHSREFYSLKRRYWHKLVGVEKLTSAASHIITVSENTKRDLMRFFSLPEDKISIIYPGIDYRPMNKELATSLVSKLALPEKFFIYVGTLEPRKNIISIIKAFDKYHREYPDVHLLIVGSRGWIYNNVLKYIKERSFVHYLDYVASPLKDALYFLSQGLIWPSFYEGFGFPPLEAIAHKKPVIISYKTSLPEIGKQQALYVDPYNISDIYQSLKFLTEDKKLKEQLAKSADSFALPQWSEQTQKILAIFNQYKK